MRFILVALFATLISTHTTSAQNLKPIPDNNPGLPDLLVGAEDGFLYFLPNTNK